MRRILMALAVLMVTAAAAVSALLTRPEAEAPVALPESPMPGRLLVGFQDDVAFRYAPERMASLDRARSAHATVVRTIVEWHVAAPERPTNAADSFDPAYRLDDVDELARTAQQRGIELLVTIWGTPAWANAGLQPNRPPANSDDLRDFAQALADRYSGRHAGYPAVRLFSAWNEPNLEQFLAPQFDAAGRSVGPARYASIARAIYDGVRTGNPEALVALGETSPRGRDHPSRGAAQDSHSPPRFARLLAEQEPRVELDAWAQHPYPPRHTIGPEEPVRWPRVGLANLERFGTSLDGWFDRKGIPVWITEYGHETVPLEPRGVTPERQAQLAEEALALAAENPRVRVFVWFILRDASGTPWQSGLLADDGSPKPALAAFTRVAKGLDARNSVVPAGTGTVRLRALELAYSTPAGDPIVVEVDSAEPVAVPLGSDGWIEVELPDLARGPVDITATNSHGQAITRLVDVTSNSH